MANKAVEFDIQGGKELMRKLRILGPHTLRVCAGSLYRSGERIMERSKSEFVPVDTGNLMSTGVVTTPEILGDEAKVQLGYGGPAAPYAIAVHEINKGYKNGRTWKYLSQPLEQAVPDIRDNLVNDINDAFNTLA